MSMLTGQMKALEQQSQPEAAKIVREDPGSCGDELVAFPPCMLFAVRARILSAARNLRTRGVSTHAHP